jgi:hypothetical protein
MNEVVVAVYDSARAAQTAVDDLNVARVPSVTVKQFVDNPSAPQGLMEVRNGSTMSGDRIVAVTVEDRHASVVMDILGMQAPVSMTEAPLEA